MVENDSGSLNRRTVLRQTATTGIGGIALAVSGSGSAVAVRQPPESTETERLLDEYGEELLSTLQSEGIVSDWGSLPTDVSTSLSDLSTGGEGTVSVTGLPGNTEVRIGTQTESGHLTVAIQPEQSRAYAVFEDQEGGRFIVDDGGIRDFDSQDIECSCENIDCDGKDTYLCCDGDSCISSCDCDTQ